MCKQSRPLRPRGLKYRRRKNIWRNVQSRPLRPRGLKSCNDGRNGIAVCRGPCGRVKGLFSNSPFFYGKLRKIIHFQRKRLRFPLAGKRKSFKIGGRRFAKPFKKRTARSALMKERLIFVFTISLSLYCHFSGSKAPLRR